MKILIVTQKVDRADPILGFFHAWITEFAKHSEHVTVISQQTGSHALPQNIQVVSLRKEDGRSQLAQIVLFWRTAWKLRPQYDAVFVHMTPIWVLLGAPLWLTLRKPIYLWYEIKRGSLKLSLALLFVRKVFMASAHGLPKRSAKQVITGHGIDTALFAPESNRREKGLVVAVGRITDIKHYEVILKAFAMLPQHCRLFIAGGTVTSSDQQYKASLNILMQDLGITDRVQMEWVAPDRMPELLQRADLFLHASQGGLDKALLQAMACECPVVSTSIAAHDELPYTCAATEKTMQVRAQDILQFSDDERLSLGSALRKHVGAHHSLPACIGKIVTAMHS